MSRRHSPHRPSAKPAQPATGRRSNRAVFQFALIFVAVSAAGIAFEYYLMANDAAQGYRALVASAGNWLPHCVGVQSRASGSTISVAGRVLEVTPECSGIEAMGVFLAGVLAFPCGRRNTLIGIVLGFVGVGLLNILRVSGLTMVAQWMPSRFDPTHDALTHLFPLFAVLPLWLVWLAFVVRRQTANRPTDPSARNVSNESPTPNLKGT